VQAVVGLRDLPVPARAIAEAASTAVAAANRREAEAFESAATVLAAAEGSGLVLGSVVRLLLEEHNPDGLGADEVKAALVDCVTWAQSWAADIDPHAVLVLLASALGVHDPDGEVPDPSPHELTRHGALLTASLLGPRPIDRYLQTAFTEIRRRDLHDDW
jgi:hypothetical protein